MLQWLRNLVRADLSEKLQQMRAHASYLEENAPPDWEDDEPRGHAHTFIPSAESRKHS